MKQTRVKRNPVRTLSLGRLALLATCNIGGQAVIEGVMMRSPSGYAVAARRADGSIAVKREPLKLLSERSRLFKLPVIRGVVTLISALYLGIKTLNWSANEAMEDLAEEERKKAEEAGDAKRLAKIEKELAKSEEAAGAGFWGTTMTMIVGVGLGLVLFLAIPHLATLGLGRLAGEGSALLDETSFAFHLVDGVIKAALFLLYLWGISFLPDIRRVFAYHGAEHKSIYTYERGLDLTPDRAAEQSRLHPRCGTSFLFFLIALSIVIFAASFPLMPELAGWPAWARRAAYVLIKIPLMMPIAGIAYEFIRASAKKPDNPLVKAAVLPGLLLQRITTREPDRPMLEVAIRSIHETLAFEPDDVRGCEQAA